MRRPKPSRLPGGSGGNDVAKGNQCLQRVRRHSIAPPQGFLDAGHGPSGRVVQAALVLDFGHGEAHDLALELAWVGGGVGGAWRVQLGWMDGWTASRVNAWDSEQGGMEGKGEHRTQGEWRDEGGCMHKYGGIKIQER